MDNQFRVDECDHKGKVKWVEGRAYPTSQRQLVLEWQSVGW